MEIKTDRAEDYPNHHGYFGEYGGQFVPEILRPALIELAKEYEKFKNKMLV